MVSKKQSAVKIRKKKWLTIIAPKLFNEQPLGETPTYENESVVGRHLTYNLMNLARDAKKQAINLRFKVKEVIGEKAFTEFIGYEILPSAVRRLVRREKDKIDDSFIVLTKDEVKILVKPLLITRNKTVGSILSRLRKETKIAYQQTSRKLILQEFLSNAVSGALQKSVRDRLCKIYPVRISEIRTLRVLGNAPISEQKPLEQETQQPPQTTPTGQEQKVVNA